MRSSTSGFDVVNPSRAIVLLLAAITAYFGLLEVFAREVLPRISENQRRITDDGRVALKLRPTDANGARTVLLVGNSLLVHGIDRQRLVALMGPDYEVTLYPIEGTTYLDWAYGLRSLFSKGSRPGIVVLCISAKHLLVDATIGEGFAYRLMRLQDLPKVARDAHLNTMSASAYFFANMSGWLGTRSTFRDGLMLQWLPHAEALALRLSEREQVPLVVNAQSTKRAVQRLESMRALTDEYHAKFIWLVPPTLNARDVGPALAAAAVSSHLSVLMPSKPGAMASAEFLDGFHLNPTGAAEFTQLAADALREELGTHSLPATGPGSPPSMPHDPGDGISPRSEVPNSVSVCCRDQGAYRGAQPAGVGRGQ